MSAPIAVYGQETYVGEVVVVLGWKEISNGRAAISVSGRFCSSVWIDVLEGMYPAVERAGCIAFAHESLMELWAPILLMCRHWKAWSPYSSCVLPHLQVGRFVMEWIGSLSLRLREMSKLQFGSRWEGLLRFIPIRGYDVCGDKMLGSR